MLISNGGAGSVVYQLYGSTLLGQQIDGSSQFQTYITDGLGSVRVEMETSGATNYVRTFSPFGETLSETGTSTSVYGYTGQQEDESMGLIYLRARYYNPETKLFNAYDLWDGVNKRPQSLNHYAYTEGNSINLVDPTGQFGCTPDGYLDNVADCSVDYHDEALISLGGSTPPVPISKFSRLYPANPYEIYPHISPARVPHYRNQVLDTGFLEAVGDGVICAGCGPATCQYLQHIDSGNPSDPRIFSFGQVAMRAVRIGLNRVEKSEPLHPALALTLDWYFEKGPDFQSFDISNQMTRDIIAYEGTREKIQEWKNSGRKDMTTGTVNFKDPVVVLNEFSNAMMLDDWTMSMIGSFDIVHIRQSRTNPKVAEVAVENKTRWQSATRIPGYGPLRPDEPRGTSGFGGTIKQRFEWSEYVP